MDVDIERLGIELDSIPNLTSFGIGLNTNVVVWMEMKLVDGI